MRRAESLRKASQDRSRASSTRTATTGWEERCDSLEQSYTGASVIRLRLTEGATNAQIVDELITALTDPRHVDIELAMVLNADTMLNALDAFDQIFTESGRSIRILSIGATVDLARVSLDIRNRHLRALFNDSVESQGYLVMSAMQFVHNYHTPAELVGSPQLWMASPYLLDSAKARAAGDCGGTALAHHDPAAVCGRGRGRRRVRLAAAGANPGPRDAASDAALTQLRH